MGRENILLHSCYKLLHSNRFGIRKILQQLYQITMIGLACASAVIQNRVCLENNIILSIITTNFVSHNDIAVHRPSKCYLRQFYSRTLTLFSTFVLSLHLQNDHAIAMSYRKRLSTLPFSIGVLDELLKPEMRMGFVKAFPMRLLVMLGSYASGSKMYTVASKSGFILQLVSLLPSCALYLQCLQLFTV